MIGGCLIMLLVFPLLGLSQGWWQLALAFYVLGVSFAGMDVAMNIQAVDVERLLGSPACPCCMACTASVAWRCVERRGPGRTDAVLALPHSHRTRPAEPAILRTRVALPDLLGRARARAAASPLPPRALLGLGLLILCVRFRGRRG